MTLTPSQLAAYADVLIWGLRTARTKPLKVYDTIMVRYDLEALSLAEIVFRKLIRAKYTVVMRSLSSPTMEKDFYTYSDSTQRKFVNAGEKELYKNLCGNIFLSAPSSLTHLKGVDPKKMGEAAIARKSLREIAENREAKGLYGWTLCTLPTPELAKQAKLSIEEYTQQIVKACFLDTKDPVQAWRKIFKQSQSIKKWLNALPIKTINVQTKSMDLEILLGKKRRFMGVSGHNIPSFEIFTSPDWHGTRGTYFANLPTYKSGNYIKNIHLVFEKGRAVKISAEQGESFVKKTLAMDPGAAQLGEFSLTDIRFSKIDKFMADILYDENFGGKYGNCHVAVGASYADTFAGSQTSLTKAKKKQLGYNDSALHWDIINTEDKVVTAKLKNGKTITIYEKGMFKY